jgi:hypothetical protein
LSRHRFCFIFFFLYVVVVVVDDDDVDVVVDDVCLLITILSTVSIATVTS